MTQYGRARQGRPRREIMQPDPKTVTTSWSARIIEVGREKQWRTTTMFSVLAAAKVAQALAAKPDSIEAEFQRSNYLTPHWRTHSAPVAAWSQLWAVNYTQPSKRAMNCERTVREYTTWISTYLQQQTKWHNCAEEP